MAKTAKPWAADLHALKHEVLGHLGPPAVAANALLIATLRQLAAADASALAELRGTATATAAERHPFGFVQTGMAALLIRAAVAGARRSATSTAHPPH